MKVIDGDGHVVEPRNAFVDYIDPKFRERAPQVITDETGRDVVRIDGQILFGRKGPTSLGASFVIGGYADPAKRRSDPYDQAHVPTRTTAAVSTIRHTICSGPRRRSSTAQ